MKTQKITAKDPAEKLAHKRLSVLQLAEELKNISEACRKSGMDRMSFYEWKRRFQTPGFAGLKDLPPVHHTHSLRQHPMRLLRKFLERTSRLGMHENFRFFKARRDFSRFFHSPEYPH